MERKQSKNEKQNKSVDNEKIPSFSTDVKTLKENLKIREILRTVKMNSSMRIKAPRGSKVMQNKDFNDNEDIFEGTTSSEGQELSEPASATNHLVIIHAGVSETSDCECVDNNEFPPMDPHDSHENNKADIAINVIHKSNSLCEGLVEDAETESIDTPSSTELPLILVESYLPKGRDRKLSLDQTMLSKRETLSQSEVDLHSIGKLPLERKSSFFKKKMDSFLKNTTEIFKKQSSRSTCKQSIQRKGSSSTRKSVSMQSLHGVVACSGDYDEEDEYNQEYLQGSSMSLRTSPTPVHSSSSLSICQTDRVPPDQLEGIQFADSRPYLSGSQPIGESSSSTTNDRSESYNQESFLQSRAISMNSGLDAAHGPRTRKRSRSNRVTWVASESLTDYFRRLIHDEKTLEITTSHSNQATISDSQLSCSSMTDSKGRRLSYQRAVSGEDPVLPTRSESILRKRIIPETSEGTTDIASVLAKFAKFGIPVQPGIEVVVVSDEALAYLCWAEREAQLEEHFDWKTLPPREEERQAVIKEFIHTEAAHISHLANIVEVYISTAHGLQNAAHLLFLDTSRLFRNVLDVLNANLRFWEVAICPMIADSFRMSSPFNTDLMAPGFAEFANIFDPYEEYVCGQSKAVDYLRDLSTNPEFMQYLTWCQSRNTRDRLQLSDLMVKPMQRLTKYSLIIRRIKSRTESDESKGLLQKMETTIISYVHTVNRVIRRNEEVAQLEELEKVLEPLEIEFKDEELDKYFNYYKHINLKSPMADCDPYNLRNVLCHGEFRFRDSTMKEIDVHAIVLTDMLLICKKITKGGLTHYRMVRPQYNMDRLKVYPRFIYKNNISELTGYTYIVLDNLRNAVGAFYLTEQPKDPNSQQVLKTWDQKFREAKFTYSLSKWFYQYPVKDLSVIELDYTTDEYKKSHHEDYLTECSARERVAAMMHPNNRRPPTRLDITDAFNSAEGPPGLREMFQRPSVGGTSLTSYLSSSRQSSSCSAASQDEPQYKAGSSITHLIRQNLDDVSATSLTVNVVSEPETEVAAAAVPSLNPSHPMVVLQRSSANSSPVRRSSSSAGTQQMLQVSAHPSAILIKRSMPDLSKEQAQQTPSTSQIRQSASDKLYQSHQEVLLQQNRRSASHYLNINSRGNSYPPATRGLLKRDYAFSYSFQCPSLIKMEHASSLQFQMDVTQASTSQAQDLVFEAQQEPIASISADKTENKKKSTGNKITTTSSSSEPVTEDRRGATDGPSAVEGDKNSRKGGKKTDKSKSRSFR